MFFNPTVLTSLPPSLVAYIKEWSDEESMSVEVDGVEGNTSKDMIKVNLALFRYLANANGASYGVMIGKRFKMIALQFHYREDVDSDKARKARTCQTVFEIPVEKGGTLLPMIFPQT